MALGRENLSICLQDGQFVYKTGRGPTTTTIITITWRFPEGVLKEEIQLWRRSACARELRRPININVVGKNRKNGGTNNIVVYLCGVRAWISINLFTRRAICLQDGEGSNNKNNNNNMAFPRGGPERGNPAMTTKRLRQGVKETHQHKCRGKKI